MNTELPDMTVTLTDGVQVIGVRSAAGKDTGVHHSGSDHREDGPAIGWEPTAAQVEVTFSL